MIPNRSVCVFYRKHIIERKALLSINRCNLRSWQQLVCMSMLPWCSALVSASPLAARLPARQSAWCNIQIIRDQADKWSLISGDKVRRWMNTGQKTSIRVSRLLTTTPHGWLDPLLIHKSFASSAGRVGAARRPSSGHVTAGKLDRHVFVYFPACPRLTWLSDFRYGVRANHNHLIRSLGSGAEEDTSINIRLCRNWHSVPKPWGNITCDPPPSFLDRRNAVSIAIT